MGINLPCGNKPLITNECGGDCDEKIERLAERVSEAEEKLDTIQEGAEVNVNADWEETDPDSDAYIENKPSVNYDLSLGDSAPTVGSAVVGSAVLGTLVDIILGRGDGTEDRVSVSGTGAIQITRDGDTMTIHVPVGEIDQLRNGTDTEARAWAANVLKQWLDERIAQIPADQFLDLNKTVFANPFSWSSTTYPGSINPNLDGKPVLVLALTDGENVSYSFLNMEDLIDAYEGVAPISVNGSQISHDNSGVTAGSYGDSSNQTPNFGDTFKALRSTVDAKGHVTSMSEHTVKIPDTLATQESAGLMSAEDKEKLDNVDQLYKTTCGNPIVIDDADGEVKALNVELTPIQDLHGYDKPWAAGAGKNKIIFPYSTASGTSFGGLNVTYDDEGIIRITGTRVTNASWVLNTITLPAGTYTATTGTTLPEGLSLRVYDSVSGTTYASVLSSGTFTLTATTTLLIYFFLITDIGTIDATVKPQIEQGSTATSWTPYENICPIYPHTSLPVRDTGKNLLDPKFYARIRYNPNVGESAVGTGGLLDVTDRVAINGNTYSQTGDAWAIPMCMITDIEKYVGNPICLSGTFTGDLNILNGLRSAWIFTDKNYIVTRIASAMNLNPPFTLTPASGEKYLIWYINSSAVGTITLNEPQLELGDTATTYAPYTGQTVTVPLNDLYGGSVDVIGGQDGQDTWAAVDLGTLTWSRLNVGTNAERFVATDIPIKAVTTSQSTINGNLLCSIYEEKPWATLSQSGQDKFMCFNYSGGAFAIRDTTYTSVADFKTAMSGIYLVYEKATPTPLTTTPTALTLYKGDNVISSDGDMCITYLQDRGDLTDFINDMKECCEEVKGSLLENLVDGSAQGSLRGIDTAQEDANYTLGTDATALGNGTKASGDYSVAEGTQTEASGLHSHAEGVQTKAMQQAAHAEGAATTANALFAHSEGNATNATGRNGHAEGGGTTASGENAHAEGGSTTASAHSAHAEGGGCFANANYSHAEGNGTKAVSMSQHVGGEFNELDPTDSATTRGTYVEIIGNGTSDTSRSNARTLDWNGNEALQGALTLGKGTADEVTITAAQLQQLLTLI